MTAEMLFIDSDNALGSARGDVDDAYAIAALILGGAEIAAIASCAGNTDEASAFENNKRLCSILGWNGPLLRGVEARTMLRAFPGRIVALGPLTNVAGATAASEVILVGTTRNPLWPHEFNLTRDRQAWQRVLASPLPLTIFPLDVIRKLHVRRRDLDAIPGALGEALRRGTERWFRHLRFVRLTGRFAIYDLAAALYALDEEGLTMEHRELGRTKREVKICTKLDGAVLWKRFLSLVQPAMSRMR